MTRDQLKYLHSLARSELRQKMRGLERPAPPSVMQKRHRKVAFLRDTIAQLEAELAETGD